MDFQKEKNAFCKYLTVELRKIAQFLEDLTY